MPIVVGGATVDLTILARDLIRLALGKLAVISPESVISNPEFAIGLDNLNLLLDKWSVQRNAIFVREEDQLTLQVGKASYTIGQNADFDTARPISPEQAYIRLNNIDYGVDCGLSQEEYNALPDKSSSGRPSALFYKPDFELGTIYFDSTPDQAYAFYLFSWKPFSTIPDINTSLALPPGYKAAIVANLAVDVAPAFRAPVSQTLYNEAENTLTNIKAVNHETPYMKSCAAPGTTSSSSGETAFLGGISFR